MSPGVYFSPSRQRLRLCFTAPQLALTYTKSLPPPDINLRFSFQIEAQIDSKSNVTILCNNDPPTPPEHVLTLAITQQPEEPTPPTKQTKQQIKEKPPTPIAPLTTPVQGVPQVPQVPEFLKIQLNKVEAKPLTQHVILTTNPKIGVVSEPSTPITDQGKSFGMKPTISEPTTPMEELLKCVPGVVSEPSTPTKCTPPIIPNKKRVDGSELIIEDGEKFRKKRFDGRVSEPTTPTESNANFWKLNGSLKKRSTPPKPNNRKSMSLEIIDVNKVNKEEQGGFKSPKSPPIGR